MTNKILKISDWSVHGVSRWVHGTAVLPGTPSKFFQQMILADVEWKKETKIPSLIDTWMMDSFLRWTARKEVTDYLHCKFPRWLIQNDSYSMSHTVFLALIKKTSFEKVKKKFPFILRLNQVNRPLNGLVHIQSLSEDIEFEKFYDEENEK